MTREAMLWHPLKDETVQCELCSHYCAIKAGERGKCGVRENRGGTLMTLVDERVAAINLDPVEKKPLYHFLPGTTTFSFGTMGCNLACSFCQNYSLSQPPREGGEIKGQQVTPEQLVAGALENGASSISYTYSEPTIFFELMYETANLAVRKGLRNIIVSNGFMTGKCLEKLDGLIHAANIDLKAYTAEFYEKVCGARLAPVLENLKTIKKMGWWLETTTLVIPGLNDSREELGKIAAFIRDELSPDTPWHVSRFHPTYRMLDRDVTPSSTLDMAYETGRKAGLKHIYVGNVPGHPSNSTFCPKCGCLCITRRGFFVAGHRLEDGSCAECGEPISGVGLEHLAPS